MLSSGDMQRQGELSRLADYATTALEKFTNEIFDLDLPGPHVLCSDFNAHHPEWDDYSPEDEKGQFLAERAEALDYEIVNDPEIRTRHARANARQNPTSPDVTLARECECSNWSSTFTSLSDHYYIL
jgi:hypothetical protein